jgi:hypothetical protein
MFRGRRSGARLKRVVDLGRSDHNAALWFIYMEFASLSGFDAMQL